MKQIQLNYKSDFNAIIGIEGGWGVPFKAKFWTGTPSRSYCASWDGADRYINCHREADGRICFAFDSHNMGTGKLMLELTLYLDNQCFADGVCSEVIPSFAPVFVDENDEEYTLILDYKGMDTLTTIGTLPAYYQAGLTPEEHQALLDATRDANAAAANADDTAEDVKSDVRDFMTRQGEDIREAIELMQKAGVAVKAMGDEAKSKGDYAKEQGDRAKECGDYARDMARHAESAGDDAMEKAAQASIAASRADNKANLADQKATLANTAAFSANKQAAYAKDAELAAIAATAEAEKVNAELSGNTVTITDRNGHANSVDLLNVVDDLTTEDPTKPLSANQGKILADMHNELYDELFRESEDPSEEGVIQQMATALDQTMIQVGDQDEKLTELRRKVDEIEGDVNHELYGEELHLVGFGTNGVEAGITKVGQVYYNINSKLLRRQYSVGNYETIPYIYAFYVNDANGKVYKYNGEELIEGKPESRISDLLQGISDIKGELNVSKTITLNDIQKREKGIFVSYENGTYGINAESSAWESWVIPAKGISNIFATLGRSTHLQCNIVFFKSNNFEVSEIISHVVGSGTIVNYDIQSIPNDCKFVVLSNRIATLDSPNATITTTQYFWDKIKENSSAILEKANISDLQDEIESLEGFYKAKYELSVIPDYKGVIAKYDELLASYPSFVTRNDLGLSSDGINHIFEYVFTSGNYNTSGQRNPLDAEIAKPKILLMAGIHGYEPGSVMSLLTMIQSVCRGDRTLISVRNGYEIHVIPVVNPHGHNTNRRGNYNNVDINRNFDANWTLQGDQSVNPSYYGGQSPASEAETRIVQNWMELHSDSKLLLDFHNSSFKEVSCLGGAGADNIQIKKKYLLAISELEPYFRSRHNIDSTYRIAYTYGTQGSIGGGSRAYMNKVGIMGGGVLETCEYTNTSQTPDSDSISIGAEVLGNMLKRIFDLFE